MFESRKNKFKKKKGNGLSNTGNYTFKHHKNFSSLQTSAL